MIPSGDKHNKCPSVCNGIIFIINDTIVAIIFNSGFYHVFDPNGRNSTGMTTSDGFSIFITFDFFSKVENYIKDVHVLSQNLDHSWFLNVICSSRNTANNCE